MNYKDKVYSIVEGYINKAAELTAWEKDLKRQKDAGTIARVKLEELQADLRQQRSAAYQSALEQIEQTRREHAAAVEDWNRLDGSKLDKDAELLKLDVPMTQTQYQQLCTKHKDNSLMLSLLCAYADKHPEEPLYAYRPADAKTRVSEFDLYADRAKTVCREPQDIRSDMFLANIGVPEAVSYEY